MAVLIATGCDDPSSSLPACGRKALTLDRSIKPSSSSPSSAALTHSPAVLVTGGSGYIGSHLVAALAEQGDTVVSMYRHRLPEPRERVFPVCSDLSAEELLAAPLRGVHTVVHLAWERNFLGPEDSAGLAQEDALAVKTRNLKLLSNLLAAMEKANTRRIIFVSAIGADMNSDEAFLREKYLGEFLTLNSNVAERIVVRPTLVFGGQGKREPFVNAIKRVMRFPAVYPLPRSRKNLYPLHIHDLVTFLKKLVKEPLPEPCAVVDMRGEEGYRVDELFRLVHERLNRGSRLALGSVVGPALLSLFERDSSGLRDYPRLKHFLAIGQEYEAKLRCENPILDLMPTKFRSFKEAASSELLSEFAAPARCQATLPVK